MLTEYVHHQTQGFDRELRELALSRPRLERPVGRRRSPLRDLVRRFALSPARATSVGGGGLPDIRIRPALPADTRALARLAEANERPVPSGPVLVAEIESEVVAAVPVSAGYVLTDLWRPMADVVQLLELRTEQLRAARLEKVA